MTLFIIFFLLINNIFHNALTPLNAQSRNRLTRAGKKQDKILKPIISWKNGGMVRSYLSYYCGAGYGSGLQAGAICRGETLPF
jgi:hypothetical protein